MKEKTMEGPEMIGIPDGDAEVTPTRRARACVRLWTR